jgi:effector-binding domain-containing protein
MPSLQVELRRVAAQPLSVVRGGVTRARLPQGIRALFDQFYSNFKSNGELNVVYYPEFHPTDEFSIECGVQVASGGNSATPAGEVATVAYFGPYDRMSIGHGAIHEWVQANGRKLAGPSWEVYGHWTEDTSKLRTDIYYLLR